MKRSSKNGTGQQAFDRISPPETLYRTIVENTGTAIMIVAGDGTVVYANAEFEKSFGYPRSDLEGTAFWDRLPDSADRERMIHYHRARRVDPSAAPRTYEAALRDASGARRNVVVTVALIPGSDRSVVSFMDITEKKRAEEALRLSEEKYRTLVEGISEVIFTVDPQGRITYMSPALERLTGYRVSEVVGEPFSRYVHPEDLPGLQASFGRTLAGAQEPHEFRVFDRDGSLHHVVTSSRPLTDDGRLVGLIGVLTDITDRKLAEEALRKSEEMYRSITQRSFDVIVTVDCDGRITYISPAVKRILGYKPKSVTGTRWLDYVVEPEQPEVLDFVRMAREGAVEGYQVEMRHKNGAVVTLEFNVSPVPSAADCAGFQAIGRDITDRKRIREELAYHAYLLDHVSDAVIATDEHFMITAWNRAAEDLYGWEAEQAIGRALTELIHSDTPGAEPAAVLRELEQEGSYRGELMQYREGGQPLSTDITATALKETDGGVTGYILVARDVTARIVAESIRKRAFEQIEQNMEQFAILGDHIRHPLQVIMARADLLEDEATAANIREQVKRINGLVRQLDEGSVESREIREFLRKNELL
ncbi:PAS domain S-box protein [Methanoculleus sp. FWC-SCC1]|uniref:PAS domain S-box protein n=1 Tax=Methanoculleus frigidifontis TaxID=2584085 RepID=A0ABT8MDB7_9EURY|nr:PAS domain S-box protein [Methanoculleus sp. FWC-SCC1]MDN7025850.1 PAS domain S-box protein [Methanoculleus sp. FWC-SCC1]